ETWYWLLIPTCWIDTPSGVITAGVELVTPKPSKSSGGLSLGAEGTGVGMLLRSLTPAGASTVLKAASKSGVVSAGDGFGEVTYSAMLPSFGLPKMKLPPLLR